jgi:hypothetical protein
VVRTRRAFRAAAIAQRQLAEIDAAEGGLPHARKKTGDNIDPRPGSMTW